MRKLFCGSALALGLFLGGAALQAAPRAVWIDTDLSLGSPLREVDDAYALLLALRSPELRIVGMSTTYGNAPLWATTERTRKSLGAFHSSLPVYPGAASPGDLGRATAASAALAAALRRERLTYVALGPLTNLATFLRLYPQEAGRLEQIILLAGRTPGATLGFGPKGSFRIHDANLVKDRAAMRGVLRTPIPLLLTPIEMASRLTLSKSDLRTIERSGPAGRYLAKRSGYWLWFWQHIAQAEGGPIFDALAVLAAAQPKRLTIEKRTAAFTVSGDLVVRQRGGRPVFFCSGFDRKTRDLILRRLSGRPKKSSNAPPDQ